MLSHIFTGPHSFAPYKYNCKYCFALNLVKAIIFQSKLTICQQAVFNSFPTQFKRQKMKCSLWIDSSQSIHIKNPSATNHPKTTQPNVSISYAYSHLDSTSEVISWEWVEELTYSIQFPKRENLNIYMVSWDPPVSTKKISVYHNLSPVFLCPEGSSVMLFAPKMLLEDLWPMMTIHPTIHPQSLFNHLYRPRIDLTRPPMN